MSQTAYTFVAVNTTYASAGPSTIIAAPSAGQSIRLRRFTLSASAAVTVTLQSGTNNISGPINIPAAGTVSFDAEGAMSCGSGNYFAINASAACTLSGFITYEVVSALR